MLGGRGREGGVTQDKRRGVREAGRGELWTGVDPSGRVLRGEITAQTASCLAVSAECLPVLGLAIAVGRWDDGRCGAQVCRCHNVAR